ncbi:hypothetical protein FB566_3943 [Stackebrandtia endophytica]|uniref:Uncharacterized protein n=2 Tax=Stackebrandtia endophytica TaxID=1496996 RepID=A0A543B0R0_9ACTN|nr:hypothetical protein FB566_3943 [Stackebrandtia endophytica]
MRMPRTAGTPGAPISGPPGSGPFSGAPFSGGPVSGSPTSGSPFSAAPFSSGLIGRPLSSAPTSGTVYGLPMTDDAPTVVPTLGRPIDPVRSTGFHANARALELMATPAPPSGLVLGRDAEQKPVVAPMFRPEPVKSVVVGGAFAARVIVFRALAVGARVAVCTTRPQLWEGLGRGATGRDDRLAVLHGDRPVTVDANPHSPALYVYDVGEHGTATTPILGPWRTQLTILPKLTLYGSQALEEAQVTILQRITSEEVPAASASLRVSGETIGLFQMLYDDMFAMLRIGAKERYVWANATSIERQMFGEPVRDY